MIGFSRVDDMFSVDDMLPDMVSCVKVTKWKIHCI